MYQHKMGEGREEDVLEIFLGEVSILRALADFCSSKYRSTKCNALFFWILCLHGGDSYIRIELFLDYNREIDPTA